MLYCSDLLIVENIMRIIDELNVTHFTHLAGNSTSDPIYHHQILMNCRSGWGWGCSSSSKSAAACLLVVQNNPMRVGMCIRDFRWY